MRAKAIAAVLGLVLLVAPAAAVAAPTSHELPGYTTAQTVLHAPNGYVVVIGAFGRHVYLGASSAGPHDGLVGVGYSRTVRRRSSDRLHLGLGDSGEIDLRFVPDSTEREPFRGCTGDPTIVRDGHFVGTISFHPPGGFISLDLRRSAGEVTRVAPQVCPGPPPRRGRHGGIRRLIAGERNGRLRFEAVGLPSLVKGETVPTVYFASITRRQGSLTVVDMASAQTPLDAAPLAVPDLKDLPIGITVEPPTPFSGTATFELPSRGDARVGGDLAVELPEAGEVPLIGPKTVAGLCRGPFCTGSLPPALRPRGASGFLVGRALDRPRAEVPTK